MGVTDFIASNGRVALVMEFVPGPSLEEVIEDLEEQADRDPELRSKLGDD